MIAIALSASTQPVELINDEAQRRAWLARFRRDVALRHGVDEQQLRLSFTRPQLIDSQLLDVPHSVTIVASLR
jgi:hypothetical protein